MDETYDVVLGPGSHRQEQQRTTNAALKKIEKDFWWASLTISHATMSCAEITEIIKIDPTDTLDDGDVIYESAKHRVLQKGSNWSYELENLKRDHLAEVTVRRLLDDLFGKLPAIRSLQLRGALLKIKVRFSIESNVSFLQLPPDLVMRLAQLGVMLEVQTVIDEE